MALFLKNVYLLLISHFKKLFPVFKGSLTYEALSNMKYLMMCFNESMRIYPPAIR